MRYSKIFINSFVLFAIPSVALYPQATTIPIHQTVHHSIIEDALLSYDNLLALFASLENGELEKTCSDADLEKIIYLLVHIARQGLLPNDSEAEAALEKDIQELLHGYDHSDDHSYEYPLFFGNGYDIVPAIFYGQGDLVLCKGFFHKKWDQVKKACHKHKKELLIGGAVVVAVGVVAGIRLLA